MSVPTGRSTRRRRHASTSRPRCRGSPTARPTCRRRSTSSSLAAWPRTPASVRPRRDSSSRSSSARYASLLPCRRRRPSASSGRRPADELPGAPRTADRRTPLSASRPGARRGRRPILVALVALAALVAAGTVLAFTAGGGDEPERGAAGTTTPRAQRTLDTARDTGRDPVVGRLHRRLPLRRLPLTATQPAPATVPSPQRPRRSRPGRRSLADPAQRRGVRAQSGRHATRRRSRCCRAPSTRSAPRGAPGSWPTPTRSTTSPTRWPARGGAPTPSRCCRSACASRTTSAASCGASSNASSVGPAERAGRRSRPDAAALRTRNPGNPSSRPRNENDGRRADDGLGGVRAPAGLRLPDGPPRRVRPERGRRVPRVGLRLAGDRRGRGARRRGRPAPSSSRSGRRPRASSSSPSRRRRSCVAAPSTSAPSSGRRRRPPQTSRLRGFWRPRSSAPRSFSVRPRTSAPPSRRRPTPSPTRRAAARRSTRRGCAQRPTRTRSG